MKIHIYNAMDKVLPGARPTAVLSCISALKNERINFLLYVDSQKGYGSIRVHGTGETPVLCRRVKAVDVVYPISKAKDDYILSDCAGKYYDLLEPCNADAIAFIAEEPNVFLISVCADQVAMEGGAHTLCVRVLVEGACAEERLSLRVVNCALVQNDVFVTNWMHYDCIAQWHGVPVFSKAFYEVFESYLKSYVTHGNNMLLTPIFTPALDTEVGGERLTAQLVDISLREGEYDFDFTRLKAFLQFVLSRGIEYIEFSHLLAQWGAKYCPKIIVREGEEEYDAFGWKTECNGEKYKAFLSAFLPRLIALLEEMGIKERCYFHLSDEPPEDCVEGYQVLSEYVKPLLKGCKIMDALSSFEFEKRKLTDTNVVSIDAVKPFLEKGVAHAVYNCCLPTNRYYTNRFMCFPALRMRVLGVLMYVNDAKGYLHWGYNFYNAYLSKGAIDPYQTVDVGGVYPAGDAFIVYPVEGGCTDSIRHETFLESMQDFRALKTLESLTGREYVLSLLRDGRVEDYNVYPHEIAWLVGLREKINAEIERRIV